MNAIKALKYSLFTQVKTPLGRWNIHNYRQTTLKIKYANEDNCGTCGEYIDNQDDVDELYVYMMGTDSVPDIKK
jgi:hypothetical protein